jgi:co-chaperonin GroES (HSP10)
MRTPFSDLLFTIRNRGRESTRRDPFHVLRIIVKNYRSAASRPLTVSVGDRVLFGKYTSSEITVDGEELLILRE